MTSPDQAALHRLLLERSVRRGHFVLASGRTSSFYVDCRPTTMSAEGLALIGRMGLAALRGRGWAARLIGGLTMGADPVAYAIAAASAAHPPLVDAFSVRKEAKSHGAGRRIEGNFRPGEPVVVVEDVITTGGSTREVVQCVEAHGGVVVGVGSLIDRSGGAAAFPVKHVALAAVTATTYPPEACPLCQAGSQAVKPGSRA